MDNSKRAKRTKMQSSYIKIEFLFFYTNKNNNNWDILMGEPKWKKGEGVISKISHRFRFNSTSMISFIFTPS